jgi:Fe(3+) dicitrate transport protein
MGIESMAELDIMEVLTIEKWKMPIYVSFAFNHARYNDFKFTSARNGVITESNLKGNQIENAPTSILRAGWGLEHKKFQLNIQFSRVSSFYTDAQNTEQPSANAQTGEIPGYSVLDFNSCIPIYKQIIARFSVNNILNKTYATRRAGGYPGPGILPADGRNFMIALSAIF